MNLAFMETSTQGFAASIMLVNAFACRPFEHGLARIYQTDPLSTAKALHRKGMLAGINHSPRTLAARRLPLKHDWVELGGSGNLAKNWYMVVRQAQAADN